MIRRDGLVPTLERLWKDHGDVYEIGFGPRRALIVSHPDAFERVLLGHKPNFQKGDIYDPVRDFLGDSVITLENAPWRTRRRLLQPHFHHQRLDQMFTGMASMVARFITDLRARLPEGGVIDIHREMVQLTLDVVFTALFGSELELDRASYEVLSDSPAVMNERMNSLRLPLWLPTAANRRFNRTLGALDASVYTIIEAATQRVREGHDEHTLLAMLLETVDEDSGAKLSVRDVRDEVLTLYVAGHETTALLMTWLFVLLGGQTEAVAGIEAEIDAQVSGALPSFAELPGLGYVRQVVDEVLRLRPPVAMLGRNALAGDNLRGYEVEAGDLVFPCFWNLHRHPDYWREPERFDPERFGAARSEGRDNWAYTPFSAGPRVCIGNTFALNEAVLIIAGLFRAASWELLPDQDIGVVAAGTLRPDAPVMVRVSWK